jgi:hypothetical protein
MSGPGDCGYTRVIPCVKLRCLRIVPTLVHDPGAKERNVPLNAEALQTMLHFQLLATLNATSRRSSDGANGTSASLTAGDCQAWKTFGKDTLYKAILAPNWTPYSSGRIHALVHSGAGLAGPFPSQLLDREACRMLLTVL